MALYSVWDWDRNTWAVYRDRRTVSIGDDPKPPKPVVGPLGADPDTQVKPLPSDASFVGYDHVCRGEVRRRPSGPLAGLGIDPPSSDDLQKYAVGAAMGVAAWWLFTKWKRS